MWRQQQPAPGRDGVHGSQRDRLGVHQHESESQSAAAEREDPYCRHAERARGAASSVPQPGSARTPADVLRYRRNMSRVQDSHRKSPLILATVATYTAANNSTHPFSCPLSVTTRKLKPIWILLKQEAVSGSGRARPYASLHLAPDR